MAWAKRFWAAAAGPLKLMVVVLAALTLSQFLLYVDDTSYGFLTTDADYNSYGTYFYGAPSGTGWELHGLAYVLLPALWLSFLYAPIRQSPAFDRFGWWAAIVAVFACASPASASAPGGDIGILCTLLTIVAAVLHWRARRRIMTLPKA
jgi:hypothetical protein